MPLSESHILKVCKLGQGKKVCSFLCFASGEGMVYLKKTGLEAVIQQKRMNGEMVAMGDNCSGPPHFAMFDC